MSAIALPSFLNQANKAKESEAKQYLSAINKGQQAYYTEKSEFNQDINALGVGIKTQTENYKYECAVGKAAVSCTAKAEDGAPLRDYLGHVYLVYVNDTESTSRSILCQAKGPDQELGTFQLDNINQENLDPTCVAGDMEDL